MTQFIQLMDGTCINAAFVRRITDFKSEDGDYLWRLHDADNAMYTAAEHFDPSHLAPVVAATPGQHAIVYYRNLDDSPFPRRMPIVAWRCVINDEATPIYAIEAPCGGVLTVISNDSGGYTSPSDQDFENEEEARAEAARLIKESRKEKAQ